jgi:hypothetical protein
MMHKRGTRDTSFVRRTALAAAVFGAFLGVSPEHFYMNGAPIPTAFTA